MCIVPILYSSNHFSYSSIAFFLGYLGSKSDSRNHFRFSACGLEAEKCFLNHFLNLENLGKMQFHTIKFFSHSELEQYPKQNTISIRERFLSGVQFFFHPTPNARFESGMAIVNAYQWLNLPWRCFFYTGTVFVRGTIFFSSHSKWGI